MGVTPAEEVVVADVHASGVSYLSVDHDDLPVVAIVELREKECIRICEFHNFDPGFHHLVIVSRPDGDVGDVFMDETYLHAFPCLLHQQILDSFASVVLQEVEILEMDMMLCCKQVIYKRFQLSSSGCYDLDFVVVGDGEPAVFLQEAAQAAEFRTDVLFLDGIK